MKTIIYTICILASVSLCGQDFKLGYTAPAATTSPVYNNVVLEVEGVDNTNPSNPVAKGMLIPSMTQAQQNTITFSPPGLLIYVIDQAAFFYNSNTTNGAPTWSQISSGQGNSQNGIFTLTDSVFQFNTNAPSFKINSVQNNSLSLGKAGETYINIPQSAGSGSGNTGIIITDNSDPGTTVPASLLTLNSTNKGLLLPRVPSTASISSPPFGLMVILQSTATPANNGVYINMGSPAAPNWQRIQTM